jgi:hypothetical protein
MKKANLIVFSVFILFNNFFFLNLKSQINNYIVVKVGGSLVTSLDVQNEIITKLIISKLEITQENIDKSKNFAMKSLISKSIKTSEINKYGIKTYNNQDLQNYVEQTAKNLNTNKSGLKKIFEQSNISYAIFEENYKTELLWNTLIFQLFKDQLNINIIEVDNEVEQVKADKSEEELKKIKETILTRRKEEKLSLFSRSHFTNIENSITVKFQ